MKIHVLAESFLHVKKSRDEEKRIVDYELKNDLIKIEAEPFSVNKSVKVLAKKDQIQAAKFSLEQREEELIEIGGELLEELKRADLKPIERFETHVKDKLFFSVWYDENDVVYSSDIYHKM